MKSIAIVCLLSFVCAPCALAFPTPAPKQAQSSSAPAGDWDGEGTDSIGIYVASTGAWFLRNSLSAGPANLTFAYGPPGLIPVAGDWDGQ